MKLAIVEPFLNRQIDPKANQSASRALNLILGAPVFALGAIEQTAIAFAQIGSILIKPILLKSDKPSFTNLADKCSNGTELLKTLKRIVACVVGIFAAPTYGVVAPKGFAERFCKFCDFRKQMSEKPTKSGVPTSRASAQSPLATEDSPAQKPVPLTATRASTATSAAQKPVIPTATQPLRATSADPIPVIPTQPLRATEVSPNPKPTTQTTSAPIVDEAADAKLAQQLAADHQEAANKLKRQIHADAGMAETLQVNEVIGHSVLHEKEAAAKLKAQQESSPTPVTLPSAPVSLVPKNDDDSNSFPGLRSLLDSDDDIVVIEANPNSSASTDANPVDIAKATSEVGLGTLDFAPSILPSDLNDRICKVSQSVIGQGTLPQQESVFTPGTPSPTPAITPAAPPVPAGSRPTTPKASTPGRGEVTSLPSRTEENDGNQENLGAFARPRSLATPSDLDSSLSNITEPLRDAVSQTPGQQDSANEVPVFDQPLTSTPPSLDDSIPLTGEDSVLLTQGPGVQFDLTDPNNSTLNLSPQPTGLDRLPTPPPPVSDDETLHGAAPVNLTDAVNTSLDTSALNTTTELGAESSVKALARKHKEAADAAAKPVSSSPNPTRTLSAAASPFEAPTASPKRKPDSTVYVPPHARARVAGSVSDSPAGSDSGDSPASPASKLKKKVTVVNDKGHPVGTVESSPESALKPRRQPKSKLPTTAGATP